MTRKGLPNFHFPKEFHVPKENCDTFDSIGFKSLDETQVHLKSQCSNQACVQELKQQQGPGSKTKQVTNQPEKRTKKKMIRRRASEKIHWITSSRSIKAALATLATISTFHSFQMSACFHTSMWENIITYGGVGWGGQGSSGPPVAVALDGEWWMPQG